MAPPPATQHSHPSGGLQQVANGLVSAAQYPSYTAAEIPQGQYAFPPAPQSQPQTQQELPSRSDSASSFSTAPPSATFAPSAAVESASNYLYAMQQDGPRFALPPHPNSRPHTGDGSAFGSQQKQQPQQQQPPPPLSMSMPSAYGGLSDFAVQAQAYSHGSAPDSFGQFEPSPQMLLTPGGSFPAQSDAAQHVKTEYAPWMGSFHLPSPGLTFSSRSPQWFAQAGQTSYFQA